MPLNSSWRFCKLTSIVLIVISLTLFAKLGTSSRFPLPLAASTEGVNGGKDGGSLYLTSMAAGFFFSVSLNNFSSQATTHPDFILHSLHGVASKANVTVP